MPPPESPTRQTILNKMHELVISKIKTDNILGENVYSGLLVGPSEALRKLSGKTSKVTKDSEEQRAHNIYMANLSLPELLIIQNNLYLLWQMSQQPDFSDEEQEKLKLFIKIIAMQFKQDIDLTRKWLSEQASRSQLAMEKFTDFNRLIEASTILANMSQWINLHSQITILKVTTYELLINTQQQYVNKLIEETNRQIAQLKENPSPENNTKINKLNYLLMKLKVARGNIANSNIARNEILEQCKNSDDTYNPELLRAREAELNAHYQEVEKGFSKIKQLIPSGNNELHQVIAKADAHIAQIKQSHITQEQELQQKIIELGDVKGDCAKYFSDGFVALEELADLSLGNDQDALLQLANLFQKISRDLNSTSSIQETEQVMRQFAPMLDSCLQSPSLHKVKENEQFLSIANNLEALKKQFNLFNVPSSKLNNIKPEAQPILARDADSIPVAEVEIPTKETSYTAMSQTLINPLDSLPQATLIEIDENIDNLDTTAPLPPIAEAKVIENRTLLLDNDTYKEIDSLLSSIEDFRNEIQNSDPETSQNILVSINAFKETFSENEMCENHYKVLTDAITHLTDNYPDSNIGNAVALSIFEIEDLLPTSGSMTLS